MNCGFFHTSTKEIEITHKFKKCFIFKHKKISQKHCALCFNLFNFAKLKAIINLNLNLLI